jgi:hypothetical protein
MPRGLPSVPDRSAPLTTAKDIRTNPPYDFLRGAKRNARKQLKPIALGVDAVAWYGEE